MKGRWEKCIDSHNSYVEELDFLTIMYLVRERNKIACNFVFRHICEHFASHQIVL